jgi:antitoxin ParD1/3/4
VHPAQAEACATGSDHSTSFSTKQEVIQIQLPLGLEAFVQDLIDAGRYPSPEEVVHAALGLLKDQADLRAMKLAELRKQIAVGIEQADRGECVPMDMKATLAEAVRQLCPTCR